MQPSGEDLTSSDDMIAVEREILRAVWRSLPFRRGGPLREEELRRLAGYLFRNPTHQVIFDALCELRSQFTAGSRAGWESIHDQLVQRLTRKGFPDVDLEFLLQPGGVTEDEIPGMVLRLTTAKEGTTD